MPRKLEDIDVEEISLVESAANRRRFLILKKETQMEWIESLKKFLDGGDEDEEFKLKDEDIAKAKEMDEKAIKAISGALNILEKYKDVFPQDVLNAMKTLTKYAAYGYPEKKKSELEGEEYAKELIEKAGAKLSKATREQLEKIMKIIEDLIGKKEDSAKEDFDKLPDKEVKVRLAKLASMEDAEKERIRKEEEEKDKDREGRIKTLEDEIKKLKKGRGESDQLKDEDDDEDDDKDKGGDDDPYKKAVKKNKGPLWPSFARKKED